LQYKFWTAVAGVMLVGVVFSWLYFYTSVQFVFLIHLLITSVQFIDNYSVIYYPAILLRVSSSQYSE